MSSDEQRFVRYQLANDRGHLCSAVDRVAHLRRAETHPEIALEREDDKGASLRTSGCRTAVRRGARRHRQGPKATCGHARGRSEATSLARCRAQLEALLA